MMKSFMRFIKHAVSALAFTVLSVIILTSLIAVYFIATPSGGRVLVGIALNQCASLADFSVGNYEGTIAQGFVLKDINIKDWPLMPNALIRLQQARVQIPLWDPRHISVDILNARIILPQSDHILFNGHFSDGQVKGNIFAHSVDIHELVRPFIDPQYNKDLQGYAADVDVVIRGDWREPRLEGRFFIDRVTYRTTTVTDVFGHMDLQIFPDGGQWQLRGDAFGDSGLVTTRRVTMDLQKSMVTFKEDIDHMSLDIHGGAKVDSIDITLIIRGTLAKPLLKVISDPPLPEDVALLVLATGKSWSASSSMLNKSSMSGEMAGDFMDYFLLGGGGGGFARAYGLSDSGMQFDDEGRKIGLKKKLTEDLKVGFEVEQMQAQAGETDNYVKKLQGEMDVSEHVSFNVSKRVLPQDHNNTSKSTQQLQEEGETQVYLQYKEKF